MVGLGGGGEEGEEGLEGWGGGGRGFLRGGRRGGHCGRGRGLGVVHIVRGGEVGREVGGVRWLYFRRCCGEGGVPKSEGVRSDE